MGFAKQVWDKDHIVEMCRTPSLVVKADKLGQPIRPLKILGVVDETALKTNHQISGIWQECQRYKINVNGCSKNFECGKCISDSKRKTNPHKSMGTRQATCRNLRTPLRMDTKGLKQVKNESKNNTTKHAENNTILGE